MSQKNPSFAFKNLIVFTLLAAMLASILFSLSVSAVESTDMPGESLTDTHGTETVDTAAADSGDWIFENSESNDEGKEENKALVFSDVIEGQWFYDEITNLVEMGVINGYPDGSFRPDNDISSAEFIKIIMASSGIDLNTPTKNVLYEGHWISPYISHAYENGILSDEDLHTLKLEEPITRSAMTKMMILSLGIDPAKIDNPFTDVSDIYASTAYNEYLLRGYPAKNYTRVYRGESYARRSEAATIAVRIMEYKKSPYEYKKNQVLQNAYESPLNTESELVDLFHILNRELISEFTFKTDIPYEIWSEYYKHTNSMFIESFYTSYLHCSYVPGENEYTIKLEFPIDKKKIAFLCSEASIAADEIIPQIITEDMSTLDKIGAIHDYIVLNCEYDFDNYTADTIPFESKLAYGVLCQGKAVCQGYAAAFNMLLERVGIRSRSVTGTSPSNPDKHAWNMVLVDGQIYFVDVTHDDPVPNQVGVVERKFYMLTAAEMSELGYTWEKSHSNIKYFY